MSTLSSAAGAYTVGLEKPSLFSLLRPYSIIANPALNVTRLSGLVGNVSLPIVSTAQTSGFVAQDAAYTSGDMAFALPCVMTPHLLTTQLKVSRKLLYSAGMDIEAGILKEVYSSLGAALDTAALLSDGSSSATTGVLATAGVPLRLSALQLPIRLWLPCKRLCSRLSAAQFIGLDCLEPDSGKVDTKVAGCYRRTRLYLGRETIGSPTGRHSPIRTWTLAGR